MNKTFRLLAICIIFSLLVSFPVKTEARPLALSLSQVSPSSCPSGDCAAGQRINAQANFNVTPLYTGGPNTLVCVYSSLEGSNKWADAGVFSITNTGTYTAGDQAGTCSSIANTPSGTELLGSAHAQYPSNGPQVFEFAFRINKTSATAGALQISIYQINAAGDTWSLSDGPGPLVFSTAASADPAYVAADGPACGVNTPCYLNSGDDLANGIGTGLKDAVDASPTGGTITILGTYNIKSNSVTLSNPQTLRGTNDASLGYSGTGCANAMLLVTGGVTVQDLNISDGSCTSPSRDLLVINSSSDVTLEYNNLLNGKDAISILDNTGNISVRFNHITGNSGYGILRASGSGSGTVKAVANNIASNVGSYQARCNNKGEVNHNFWGVGVPLSNAISTCTYTGGKQLGAAILEGVDKPGVEAETFSVTGSSQTSDVGAISISGTAGVELIVANHGRGTDKNIPFYSTGAGKIYACNDIFDVFISDKNTTNPSILNITMPYDLECESMIEDIDNQLYCGSPNSADFPLWWYDPKSSITSGWDTTGQSPTGTGASGQSGQTTTCDLSGNSISVTLDTSTGKRPNLVSDLNFTPFALGYQNSNVIFSSFTAVSGVGNIELSWETTQEANLTGYYVTRSTDPFGYFNRDSILIPAKGDGTIGGIYQYSDLGLNHGTTYWYKLEMIFEDPDLNDFYGPVSATTYGMIPTATEVTPNSIEVYGTSIAVKVKGNNFIPSSQVVWDNNLSIDLTTSYISSTELTAIIPGSLYSDPNSSAAHSITVYNPGSGGGFSPPLTFTIKNPVPTLTSITPDYSDGNPTTITLTVKGDYFVYDSDARFNGSSANVTTTFVDRNNLTASILRSKLSPGMITVTVFNPSYGGGTSAGKTFNLYTPTPTHTKVPTSTTAVYKPPVPNLTLTAKAMLTQTEKNKRTQTEIARLTSAAHALTATIIPNAILTPTLNPSIPTLINQSSPEPGSPTPTLAPGEPTYTPVPPTPEAEEPPSVWTWRLLSVLRVLAGSLAGIGLLSIPAFIVFRKKTKSKSTR